MKSTNTVRQRQQHQHQRERLTPLHSLQTTFLFLVTLLLMGSCTAVSSPSLSSTAAATTAKATKSSTIVVENDVDDVMDDSLAFLRPLFRKYPHQPVFLQCVQEIALSLKPLFQRDSFYQRAFLAMTEPERIIAFRVPWEDDQGIMHYNRGWRVEFSSVLGPYKGGLRFHPTVDEGVLKFLGFEQIFKNALTGLPLGGGKGGSDFDPKGKSDGEIRRFCQSFMTELHRYLHPSTDVPAGDIGVGGTEIGYMYGTYKRLTNRHGEGVLTGKSLAFGGSPFRPEATGYGLVYITQLALQHRQKELEQKSENGKSSSSSNSRNVFQGIRCKVSGSGNVAQYASQKLLELGAKVMTLSDSNGVLVFPDGGMTHADLERIMELKNVQRGRLSQLDGGQVSGRYIPDCTVWNLPSDGGAHVAACEIALPCATQNEIDHVAAQRLIDEGVYLVAEGANLPTTLAGQEVFRKQQNGLIYIPAKAANAGGVGVSGLEMSQNAQKLTWTPEEVDQKLQTMMADIYHQCRTGGGKRTDARMTAAVSLEEGANQAGFRKVAHAMRELGWVQ